MTINYTQENFFRLIIKTTLIYYFIIRVCLIDKFIPNL